jgi:hypothetical protein
MIMTTLITVLAIAATLVTGVVLMLRNDQRERASFKNLGRID